MQETGSRLLLVAYFQQGGIAMYPLLLASVLVFAIALERIRALAQAGRADGALLEPVRALLAQGNADEACTLCTAQPGPLGHVIASALSMVKRSPEQRQKALERTVARETAQLERYLPVVATVASVSPFVGLLGTVLGIMRAFRDMGVAGSAGGAIVAAGIAEALITTATGLFVAIVAVIAYNHLTSWAQGLTTRAQLDAEELLATLEQ
jgi:biopolymer transport protein ExbB